MKKLCSILCMALVIVMLSSVLAVTASAEDGPKTCPYDCHLSIMYNYLTPEQRDLYDHLYDSIRAGYIALSAKKNMDIDQVRWMLDYIFNEAPELCAYDEWSSRVTDKETYYEISIGYKLPISVQDQFIEDVTQLAGQFRGKSSAEGIREIHDYVIRRFTYGSVDGEDTQLAYFALKNDTAVCNGYAQTVAMLCHFAGYSCSYIDGHPLDQYGNPDGNHAWNVALIDTNFIWFDATWDDAGDEASTRWYWLDGPTMAKTHKPDPEYTPIINLTSFLPDNVTHTMYLDVNGDYGYGHGVTDKSMQTFKLSSLDARKGEYYTPALVIWNTSGRDVPVTISYTLGNTQYTYKEATVPANSNLAFRCYARQLEGSTGEFAVAWYCNGNKLGTFQWTVER